MSGRKKGREETEFLPAAREKEALQ